MKIGGNKPGRQSLWQWQIITADVKCILNIMFCIYSSLEKNMMHIIFKDFILFCHLRHCEVLLVAISTCFAMFLHTWNNNGRWILQPKTMVTFSFLQI